MSNLFYENPMLEVYEVNMDIIWWAWVVFYVILALTVLVSGYLIWCAWLACREAQSDLHPRRQGGRMLALVLVLASGLLTGCVGDNIADIAQAQAAAEAAKAAQEAAEAAQIAAGGLSAAVVAPWIVAILVVATGVAWVWAVHILPALKDPHSRPLSQGERGGKRTVVIRPRYVQEDDAPAQLPPPAQGQPPQPMTMMEYLMYRDMRREERDERR